MDLDDLGIAPEWVQKFVVGCCIEEHYKSRSEIFAELKEILE
jgi:hypothetical protein